MYRYYEINSTTLDKYYSSKIMMLLPPLVLIFCFNMTFISQSAFLYQSLLLSQVIVADDSVRHIRIQPRSIGILTFRNAPRNMSASEFFARMTRECPWYNFCLFCAYFM